MDFQTEERVMSATATTIVVVALALTVGIVVYGLWEAFQRQPFLTVSGVVAVVCTWLIAWRRSAVRP